MKNGSMCLRFAHKCLCMDIIHVFMVMNPHAETHTAFMVAFSVFLTKIPKVHSSCKESDTENLKTQHYTRAVKGTRNDFGI